MCSVVIGVPHFGLVAPEWVVNYEELKKPAGWTSIHIGRSAVATARNMIVSRALEHWRRQDQEEPGHDPHTDHVFMWDDDVLLQPDALERLLSHRLPIVGGVCVTRHEPYKPAAGRQLTPPGVLPRRSINLRAFMPGLQEVDLLGSAVLLIRRDVLASMQPPWFDFQCGPPEGADWTEDNYFCERARLAGWHIVLDFDVQAGHLTTPRVVTYADAVHHAQTIGLPEPATPELAAAAYTVRPWPPDPAHPEGIDARQQQQQTAPAAVAAVADAAASTRGRRRPATLATPPLTHRQRQRGRR